MRGAQHPAPAVAGRAFLGQRLARQRARIMGLVAGQTAHQFRAVGLAADKGQLPQRMLAAMHHLAQEAVALADIKHQFPFLILARLAGHLAILLVARVA